MSEVTKRVPSPEQRVFGDAFSFAPGKADEETTKAFFADRVASIKKGDITWLPRTLDADHGFSADLYRDEEVVATLVFDCDEQLATVYTGGEGGIFGDDILCDRVSFAEAVVAAEQFVA